MGKWCLVEKPEKRQPITPPVYIQLLGYIERIKYFILLSHSHATNQNRFHAILTCYDHSSLLTMQRYDILSKPPNLFLDFLELFLAKLK